MGYTNVSNVCRVAKLAGLSLPSPSPGNEGDNRTVRYAEDASTTPKRTSPGHTRSRRDRDIARDTAKSKTLVQKATIIR